MFFRIVYPFPGYYSVTLMAGIAEYDSTLEALYQTKGFCLQKLWYEYQNTMSNPCDTLKKSDPRSLGQIIKAKP